MSAQVGITARVVAGDTASVCRFVQERVRRAGIPRDKHRRLSYLPGRPWPGAMPAGARPLVEYLLRNGR